jgi:hypothetical protein
LRTLSVADAGRLVRCARHRFDLLLDVRDSLWPTRRPGHGINPHYADCYRAINHYTWADRQADNVKMVVLNSKDKLLLPDERKSPGKIFPISFSRMPKNLPPEIPISLTM